MAHKPTQTSQGITDQMIADRAYQIWQARGCPQGDGRADWELARQQLESENCAAWGSLRRIIARLRTRAA